MSTFEKFDFLKNYLLENDRVQLKPLDITDMSALQELAHAPEIWTYFLEKGYDEADFTSYIQAALEQRNESHSYPFVVFDKSKNQLAGMTRLYDYNSTLQTIKLGHTWYGMSFQGSGINKHCKFLLFEFAFEQLGMERIGFGVHGENLRSVAALKSVGCSQEGVLRNFLFKTNGVGRTDLLHFSILKKEWSGRVKENLISKLV